MSASCCCLQAFASSCIYKYECMFVCLCVCVCMCDDGSCKAPNPTYAAPPAAWFSAVATRDPTTPSCFFASPAAVSVFASVCASAWLCISGVFVDVSHCVFVLMHEWLFVCLCVCVYVYLCVLMCSRAYAACKSFWH